MTVQIRPTPYTPLSITTSGDPVFATTKQLARFCNVSPRTISNWDFLPRIKIKGLILFDVAQCIEALRKHTIVPADLPPVPPGQPRGRGRPKKYK